MRGRRMTRRDTTYAESTTYSYDVELQWQGLLPVFGTILASATSRAYRAGAPARLQLVTLIPPETAGLAVLRGEDQKLPQPSIRRARIHCCSKFPTPSIVRPDSLPPAPQWTGANRLCRWHFGGWSNCTGTASVPQAFSSIIMVQESFSCTELLCG